MAGGAVYCSYVGVEGGVEAMQKRMKSFHVGVAAEAHVAAQFARCEYDVSVQYGANQPEYDLVVVNGDKLMKVSVKGSQDGCWGLTQSFIKNAGYHEAIEKWLAKHNHKTLFALVQFQGITLDEAPRLYLAFPTEIADILRKSANGRGETILYENKIWGERAVGYGTVDKIPDDWKFSPQRIDELFEKI